MLRLLNLLWANLLPVRSVLSARGGRLELPSSINTTLMSQVPTHHEENIP